MESSQHKLSSVAILYPGSVHHGAQEQPVGIYQDVALASGDLLAGIVAVGIPLFPAVFTLCVSITAAVGLVARPCWARVCSRSTSWMRSSVFACFQRRKWS